MADSGTTSGEYGAKSLFIGIGRNPLLLGLPQAEIIVLDGLAAIRLHEVAPALRQRLHHETVATCCRKGAFLPARLDGPQPTASMLRALLKANAASLRSALDTVDGYVEMSVEVACEDWVAETPDDLNKTDVRADQVRAVNLRERLETIASAIRNEAGLRDSQSKTVLTEGRNPRLRMALLAPSVAAITIADRLERGLRQIAGDYHTEVSGPWPPYSFSAFA